MEFSGLPGKPFCEESWQSAMRPHPPLRSGDLSGRFEDVAVGRGRGGKVAPWPDPAPSDPRIVVRQRRWSNPADPARIFEKFWRNRVSDNSKAHVPSLSTATLIT
jgi:hypothetical protein